jgi:cytochrome c-type biogenesis protein CcmH
MSSFITLAVLLTLGVLALLLYPLLLRERRDNVGSTGALSITVLREQLGELDEQRKAGLLDPRVFEEEQGELERRALEDSAGDTGGQGVLDSVRRTKLAAVIGFSVTVLSVGFYTWLGTPESLKPQPVADARGNHAVDPKQIAAMAARLAERLQSNPNDGEGWLMLARSYSVMGRYAESAAAFGRATLLLPPNPTLLADYADIVAMAQGRRLSGEPESIIARALAMDPKHVKSLALAGSAEFERGNFSKAIEYWRNVLDVVPPDSQAAQSVKNSIADAQRRMGESRPLATTAPGKAGAPSGSASIEGVVELAESLRGQIPRDPVLFVFARAVDGSRIPLAMTRVDSAKLPYRFKLDDSMSMAPNVRLSSATKVIIGARISRSGEALAKSGDFEGFSVPVAVGMSGATVTIGSVVK